MTHRILALLVTFTVLAAFTVNAAAAGRGGVKRYSEPFEAPDFSLKDLEGNTHTLADYEGQVLILNFWATWCIPCKKEIPSLERAWKDIQDEGMQLLAVGYGEGHDAVAEYIAGVGEEITYPQGLDPDNVVSEAYWVSVLPTSYVVNPEGMVVIRVIGDYHWDDQAWLDELRGHLAN